MLINGTPDLFANLRLQSRVADVSRNLERAGQELASGQRQDLVAASGGDPGRIYALDRALERLDVRLQTAALAGARSAAIQNALAGLERSAEGLSVELMGAARLGDLASARHHAGDARTAFAAAVSALNTSFGGRSLFAGAAVDRAPLADADLILADVTAIAAAAPDTASALAQIDAYFNDPAGGFVTTRYLGSTQNAAPVEVADGARLDYAPRADDPAIRRVLHGLALAAVTAEGAYAGDAQDQLALYAAAGETLLAAAGGATELRAGVGVAEARIEEARLGAEVEAAMIARARSAIVARDPYEAASEFQALETQLQSIYVVTARMSQLSLVNFLR